MVQKTAFPNTATANKGLLLAVVGNDLAKDAKGGRNQTETVLEHSLHRFFFLGLSIPKMTCDALHLMKSNGITVFVFQKVFVPKNGFGTATGKKHRGAVKAGCIFFQRLPNQLVAAVKITFSVAEKFVV